MGKSRPSVAPKAALGLGILCYLSMTPVLGYLIVKTSHVCMHIARAYIAV